MVLSGLMVLAFLGSGLAARANSPAVPPAPEFEAMLDCVDHELAKSGRDPSEGFRVIVETNFVNSRLVLVKKEKILGKYVVSQSIYESLFDVQFGKKLEYAFSMRGNYGIPMGLAELTTPQGKLELLCSPL